MLDVDEAPKLPVTEPLTYDELYVQPVLEPKPPVAKNVLEIAKYWKRANSQLLAQIALDLALLLGYSLFVVYLG